jgi:2-polyprenyl-6-methoxyphenol hydroxylase-like FAD-dependent oxidoreductase
VLPPREFGAPMDVLWFRLPKLPEDDGPSFGGLGKFTRGRMLVLLDREDYWQTAYLVPKGGFDALRAGGIEAFRADLDRLLPGMKVAVAALADWSQVSMLSVRLNRLARWHLPGLLLIGDAAHAMSPIGGVGINLAVQDAVAAARLLGSTFAGGGPSPAELARVRRRRLPPTVAIQVLPRQIQQRFLARILGGDQPVPTPRLLRLLQRVPALQGVTARVVGLGIRPEHAGPSSEARHQGAEPPTR